MTELVVGVYRPGAALRSFFAMQMAKWRRRSVAWNLMGLLFCGPSVSLAQLPDLTGSGLSPSSGGGDLSLACSTPIAIDATVSQFADDISEIFARLHTLDATYQAVAQEAVQALRNDHSATRELLCRELTRNQNAGLEFFQRARDQVTRGSLPEPSCFDNETYLVLLGVQTVIDAYADGVQVICDSTQCATLLPPRIPECIVGCAGTAALFVIVESFQLTLDLDDQCSFEFHDNEMERMRAFARLKLAALSATNAQLTMNAMDVQGMAAQQSEMAGLSSDIVDGFDGGDRAAGGRRVLPSLSELQTLMQQQAAAQLAFETQDLIDEIESLLAASQPISLLQIPPEHGGLLLETREVVANSINSASAVGLDVSSALDRFRAGDDFFNADQFAQAYVEYQQAYQEVLSANRQQSGGGR